ncbi:MAG: NAD-dependent epimerase/dehydratase family protein [Lachnospiraceae bacterium]|nr:NAD-dependent epimerase/dehydratase family protein [Lachnospiraceae bacterium]
MSFKKTPLYEEDIRKALSSVVGLDRLNGRRIMILGSTGLIGSFMTDCLVYADKGGAGIRVCAVSRSTERLRERFGKEKGGLSFAEADVSDDSIVKVLDAFDPDIVIHAASASYPAAFISKPVEIMKSNISGAANILEYIKDKNHTRMVYVSSGEVLSRVDHTGERACYPVSKMAAETLCLSYIREYGTDVVIARPCHTFGPYVTASDNHASAQFIRMAADGEDIVLKSAGTQRRTYAYVADCASSILSTAALGDKGGIYDIATDETLSIKEFAEACAEAAGTKVISGEVTGQDIRERTSIDEQIMNYKGLADIGWHPTFPLKDAIKRSVEQTMLMRGEKTD